MCGLLTHLPKIMVHLTIQYVFLWLSNFFEFLLKHNFNHQTFINLTPVYFLYFLYAFLYVFYLFFFGFFYNTIHVIDNSPKHWRDRQCSHLRPKHFVKFSIHFFAPCCPIDGTQKRRLFFVDRDPIFFHFLLFIILSWKIKPKRCRIYARFFLIMITRVCFFIGCGDVSFANTQIETVEHMLYHVWSLERISSAESD